MMFPQQRVIDLSPEKLTVFACLAPLFDCLCPPYYKCSAAACRRQSRKKVIKSDLYIAPVKKCTGKGWKGCVLCGILNDDAKKEGKPRICS